jgi:hypothetical protein
VQGRGTEDIRTVVVLGIVRMYTAEVDWGERCYLHAMMAGLVNNTNDVLYGTVFESARLLI